MFRSTGSYEPDQVTDAKNTDMERFRSTGSYEPDPVTATSTFDDTKFRSTGSYEPDPHWDIICKDIKSFDPQALTSLTTTGLIMESVNIWFRSTGSYEPDPLQLQNPKYLNVFRSTGSYEPDQSPSFNTS